VLPKAAILGAKGIGDFPSTETANQSPLFRTGPFSENPRFLNGNQLKTYIPEFAGLAEKERELALALRELAELRLELGRRDRIEATG
jgi:hypothetical protein